MAAPLQALEDFNILLGRPTDDSITVNVIPAQTGEISFEYGTGSGAYGSETSATPCMIDEPVEVIIDGLASNRPAKWASPRPLNGTPTITADAR